MTFDGIIGNESVVTALKEMAASGRIPQAMMLYENDGGGAMPLVLAFLDAVYGHDRKVARLIHPDIHYVYPSPAGRGWTRSRRICVLPSSWITGGN